MTLWEFLTWLWYQAAKALDWFGDEYHTFRDKLANFWYYLGRLASDVYHTVSSWISEAYNDLKAEVSGWYEGLSDWINSIYGTIAGAIADVKDWFQAVVSPWIDAIWNDLTSWVNNVITGIYQGINDISGWVSLQIDNLVSDFTGLIHPLLPLVAENDKLFTLTEANFFSRLLDLIQDGYSELRLFLDHPSGYILNRIVDKGLDFIGELIAYGLGSEEVELPDKRDWSK